MNTRRNFALQILTHSWATPLDKCVFFIYISIYSIHTSSVQQGFSFTRETLIYKTRLSVAGRNRVNYSDYTVYSNFRHYELFSTNFPSQKLTKGSRQSITRRSDNFTASVEGAQGKLLYLNSTFSAKKSINTKIWTRPK